MQICLKLFFYYFLKVILLLLNDRIRLEDFILIVFVYFITLLELKNILKPV